MKKFVSILLAITVIVAACMSLTACNSKEEGKVAVTDGNGKDIANTTTPFPERMVFAYTGDISTYASTAVMAETTLKVTVVPSNATNQRMSWAVTFNNPSSSWATGKTATEYVKVIPSSDTLTAKVQCLQAFGEQIVVTVTSQNNPQATARCKVDFVKRFMGASSNRSAGEIVDFNTDMNIKYSVTYGDGTIQGTLTPKNFYIRLSDELFNTCKNAVTSGNFVFNQNSTLGTITASSLSTTISLEDCTRWMSHTGGDSSQGRAQWQTAFYNYVSVHSGDTHATITIQFDYTHQGLASSTREVTLPIRFSLSSIEVNVTSVSLSSNNFTA